MYERIKLVEMSFDYFEKYDLSLVEPESTFVVKVPTCSVREEFALEALLHTPRGATGKHKYKVYIF